jgi:hypothetical protein
MIGCFHCFDDVVVMVVVVVLEVVIMLTSFSGKVNATKKL